MSINMDKWVVLNAVEFRENRNKTKQNRSVAEKGQDPLTSNCITVTLVVLYKNL